MTWTDVSKMEKWHGSVQNCPEEEQKVVTNKKKLLERYKVEEKL